MIRVAGSFCGVKEGAQYGSRVVLGKLFCIGRIGRKQRPLWAAVVRCACGKVSVVNASNLAGGNADGCKGCRNRRISTTHGESRNGKRTALYGSWSSMRQRCNDPGCDAYPNYGGRGIRVCEQWGTFEVFREWALANGYENGLTIDRKDNDGNYEPNNCQWLTRAENTRKAQLKSVA